jgi:hypothetical protein
MSVHGHQRQLALGHAVTVERASDGACAGNRVGFG